MGQGYCECLNKIHPTPDGENVVLIDRKDEKGPEKRLRDGIFATITPSSDMRLRRLSNDQSRISTKVRKSSVPRNSELMLG